METPLFDSFSLISHIITSFGQWYILQIRHMVSFISTEHVTIFNPTSSDHGTNTPRNVCIRPRSQPHPPRPELPGVKSALKLGFKFKVNADLKLDGYVQVKPSGEKSKPLGTLVSVLGCLKQGRCSCQLGDPLEKTNCWLSKSFCVKND